MNLNRKQRRKLGITEKPATVMMKVDEVKALKINAMKITTDVILGSMAIALNDEYSFGTARINKLIDRISRQLECISQGHVTLQDILQWCEDKDINIKGSII